MKDSAIVMEEVYPVPVEKVWQAITDKEQMKEWYFTIEDFVLQKDTVFHFYGSEDENLYYHRCVILEIVPNKKFKHTWTHPTESKGQSVVTWLLEPVENGTKVTLTHEGVESFADAGPEYSRESHLEGWTEILGTSLKQFLEK